MAFDILNIASRAIAAQQLALEVTGNNMANATTPGYHVESAVLAEAMPSPDPTEPNALVGQGVDVLTVSRAANAFLSRSVRTQQSILGYDQAKSQGLGEVQNIFQEPAPQGLAETMNAFFQSWLTLSENPTSVAAEEGVIQQGQNLSTVFNQMANTLTSQIASVNQNIGNLVTQVNQLATQIAQINQQIVTVGSSQEPPNNLMDQRSALVDQLSKLVNISYAPGPDNTMDIYIGTHPLVSGNQTSTLVTTANALGFNQPSWADTGAPAAITSGTLGGNMALLYTSSGSSGSPPGNGYLTGYLQSLNNLASAIVTQVNAQFNAGYTTSGTAPSQPFFVTTGTTAATIAVTPNLPPSDIAAASSPNSPGDGSNAAAIFNLSQTAESIGSLTTTYGQYYTTLVGQVGMDGQSAENAANQDQTTLTSLSNALQSSTGVDINQQSVQMIQEQQSYMAAAKLIQTQQSIIQSLLAAVS